VSILIVTGTGTGVGKTIATAALASCARSNGIDVAVCKPVQTGMPDDDLAEVARLSGVQTLVSVARYPEPLAPAAAAALAGRRSGPSMSPAGSPWWRVPAVCWWNSRPVR
jgi:dethiobiotin synthetase